MIRSCLDKHHKKSKQKQVHLKHWILMTIQSIDYRNARLAVILPLIFAASLITLFYHAFEQYCNQN